MSKNHFLWVPAGRVLLVGVAICTVLVLTGKSVWAHGEDLSEATPTSTSVSNPSNLSSPEAAGLQAACWALTLPYGAAKMAYAIGGGIVGGLAWAITGGDMEVAKSIWIPSMTGHYIVQPENLTGESDIQTVREQARDIIEAVRRTSAICRDLTQYARKSSTRDDTIVSLGGRLDEALKIARYAASFHDITIVKRYDVGATTRGNPDELLHAFVNLITNAVHSMDRGGGTLTLETQVAGRAVQVHIRDTGCGIPEELLGQIFEPFFTTKDPGKGTGLGLYNVKTIVNKMHGTIAVESRLGEGTTFVVTFPPAEETAP